MPPIDRQRIAGVVLAYHPPDDFIENIRSYLDDLARLYVVDNSGRQNPLLERALSSYPKVTYLPQSENLGVAEGLNVAVRRALDEDFPWLLTMDQDSRARRGMIDAMLCSHAAAGDAGVAVISPLHRGQFAGTEDPIREFDFVDGAMTSGNLVHVPTCSLLGLFDSALFIDGVDHEYCLRLRRNGYRILRANRALLSHEPGHPSRALFGRLVISNHEPLRRYYIIRNRFWISRTYHVSPALCAAVTLSEALLIVAYEDRKLAKLGMMFRGFRDYRQNRLGRLRGAVGLVYRQPGTYP